MITRGVSLFGGAPRLFFALWLLLGAFGGGLGGRIAAATSAAPVTPAAASSAPANTVATPTLDAPADSQALPAPVVGGFAATVAEEAKDPRSRDGASTDNHGEGSPSAIKRPWLQATLSLVLLLSTYLLFTLRTR